MPVRHPGQPVRSPWRYGLILVVICLAVVVAAAAGWHFARTSASPSNGPVILVSLDGLRADRLPTYGYHLGRTPAIDGLAHDGIVFERAYAHVPLTLPSHVTILSAQLPFETGVRSQNDAVRADTVLMPQLLHERGYKTAAAVSTPSLGASSGLARAFDFYDADVATQEGAQPAASRSGDKTLDVARKWIDAAGSPRFLLFLQFAELTDSGDIDRSLSSGQTAYDQQVTRADGLVAQLVRWLRGRGLYDRATIIVLAGHGQGLGDHGESGHGLLLYNETLHVPLVVKLPHSVGGGRRVAAPVQHVDLLPTVLDLLDAPAPSFARGRSLRSLALGKGTPVADEAAYAESLVGRQLFGWAALQSLTDARYRYISAPREELYDLADDPGEKHNIAPQQPDVVQRMREAVRQVHSEPDVDKAAADAADPKDRVESYERYVHAASLTANGQLLDAAAEWRDFLASEPNFVAGWLQLGSVLDHAGRYSDAVDAFDRALKIDARNANALLDSGYSLLRAGKPADARARGERALELAPAQAHELLARAAVERKDWAEAERQASRGQEAGAASALVAFVQGARAYTAGAYSQALPLLERAARPAEPGARAIPDARMFLADTLGRLERYAEAEIAWKEEIARSPYNVPARVSLAMLFHAERRDNESEATIADMVRAVPTPDAYNAAVRLWTILGDKDRADEVRTQARLRFGQEATPPRRARR